MCSIHAKNHFWYELLYKIRYLVRSNMPRLQQHCTLLERMHQDTQKRVKKTYVNVKKSKRNIQIIGTTHFLK